MIDRLAWFILGTLVVIGIAAIVADSSEAKGGGGGSAVSSAGRSSAPTTSGSRTSTGTQSAATSRSTVSATKGGTSYSSADGNRVSARNGVVTKTGPHSASTNNYKPTRHDSYAYSNSLAAPWFILWASDHGWEESDLEDSSESEAALAQYNAEVDDANASYTIGLVAGTIVLLVVVIVALLALASILRSRESPYGGVNRHSRW